MEEEPDAEGLPEAFTPHCKVDRPLQLWPRPLRVAAPWMPGLLDFDKFGLGLRCQRVRLPRKIFRPACEALKIGSPSGTCFPGSMQEVCWVTFTLPPLRHYFLAEAVAQLFLRPARPLQP